MRQYSSVAHFALAPLALRGEQATQVRNVETASVDSLSLGFAGGEGWGEGGSSDSNPSRPEPLKHQPSRIQIAAQLQVDTVTHPVRATGHSRRARHRLAVDAAITITRIGVQPLQVKRRIGLRFLTL